VQPGVELAAGLQKALDEALAKLPIPKVMSYQLETDCELPGWSSVHFVRPAHGLVALHGSTVVPVKALGLTAGTQHARPPLRSRGGPGGAGRRRRLRRHAAARRRGDRFVCRAPAEIARQLAAAAAEGGRGLPAHRGRRLLDEVTALVERPNVLICGFEQQFLDVPQECLILTMKANQKYFPLLDAQGKLTNQFLVVSNISPDDASAVIGGNERVVRPRLADAKFFFDQDRKKTLEAA
jgi:glycyl-tRNA synthetase beta chain